MQKVYLLLRNNLQSGPFNVDELLQHDLKSTDLVWEEGRSAGWSYPYEIPSLKSFFHAEVPKKAEKEVKLNQPGKHECLATNMDAPFASKEVTSKNVYVSLPTDGLHREAHKQEAVEESLEDKAEAIRRRALAAAEHSSSKDRSTLIAEQKNTADPYELETKLSKSTSEIGEDYSAWLYTQQIEKKKKARKRRSFVMGASTIFLLATGFLLYRGMITSNMVNTVGVESIQEHPTKEAVPESLQARVKEEPNLVVKNTEMADSTNSSLNTASVPIKREQLPSKPAPTKTFDTQKVAVTPVNHIAKVPVGEETKPLQNVDTEQVKSEKVGSEVASAPKKKEKETLGNKIGNFFDKFKSKEKKDKAAGEVKTGGATATEDVAKRKPEPAAPNVNIANMINVSSNATGENWMMGVTGLKLTLHNKSNETLKTATVEVRYYNEDKDLLEKKVVYFNNVSPKASQTVAAPDHRLAERADYQLVSAVPKEEGYVKQ